MQESNQIAEVINLAQVRQARKAASLDPAKALSGHVVGAAGFVTLATALVFGIYIVYQAARIGALGDPFVLVAFAITGTYLVGGALMMRLTGLLNGTSRLQRATADGNAATLLADEDKDHSPILLTFPEPQTTMSGSFSLRCSQCGANYAATNVNVNCPGCGRIAQAG